MVRLRQAARARGSSRHASPRCDRDSVALRQPIRRALAIAGAGQALHLELHQALGGEADHHLAQEIGTGALLQKLARAMLSSVFLRLRSGLLATQPYRRSRGDHPLWIAGLPTPDSWQSWIGSSAPSDLATAAGFTRNQMA